jgi:hypothetical protein
MTGICQDCGVVIELDKMWAVYGCPVCRAARMAASFKPLEGRIAHQRTGEEYRDMAQKIDWDMMREELGAWQVKHGSSSASFRNKMEDLINEAEVPRLCKIPKDEASQVYELRRLFRL